MNMLDLSSSAEANRGSIGADDFEAEHLYPSGKVILSPSGIPRMLVSA